MAKVNLKNKFAFLRKSKANNTNNSVFELKETLITGLKFYLLGEERLIIT